LLSNACALHFVLCFCREREAELRGEKQEEEDDGPMDGSDPFKRVDVKELEEKVQ